MRELLGQRSSSLITVDAKAEVATAVRLMIEHNIGGLPVLAPDGTAVGFLAERDVVRAVHTNRGAAFHMIVQDVMRPAPICEGQDTLDDVMRQMTEQRLRHFVVRDNGRIIGVISLGDMVKHRLDQLETETGVLRDYLAGQRAMR